MCTGVPEYYAPLEQLPVLKGTASALPLAAVTYRFSALY